MPNSRSRRNNPSKQERAALQSAARQANQNRKQRRGLGYAVAIALVAILFTFGVLGQNLNGRGKKSTATTTPDQNIAGKPPCPKLDGSSKRQLIFDTAPGPCVDKNKVYDAVIQTTAGTLTVEIYPARAYNAANNFIFLALYHFYDGLPFHRVLRDTFVQTGDPVAPGITSAGYEFPDDGLPASSSQYVKGAMLFAHEAADANGSQILIISGPGGASLNPTFPLFGQVKKGFGVLDKINAGASNNVNMPTLRYSIVTVEVHEHKG
ncbi:MAG TPA: peptidylprolyl isomerase [Acidimicrobiales bacterium]|nr:peptidylprolyl isomerase [Acidimicrobiales bacterium]